MTQVHESDGGLGLRQFTVAEYHELIQFGVLDENTPVELLEGLLVEKPRKTPSHTLSTNLVRHLIEQRMFFRAFVNTHEPITLSDSEPEPDISVIRGSSRDFATRHPRAAETVLVVEIADNSLNRDQQWKKRIYASASISQYWIVNLEARQLEVHTQPENNDYLQNVTFAEIDTARVALEGRSFEFAVKDLLP
jgi:Uma2 family endonuclease